MTLSVALSCIRRLPPIGKGRAAMQMCLSSACKASAVSRTGASRQRRLTHCRPVTSFRSPPQKHRYRTLTVSIAAATIEASSTSQQQSSPEPRTGLSQLFDRCYKLFTVVIGMTHLTLIRYTWMPTCTWGFLSCAIKLWGLSSCWPERRAFKLWQEATPAYYVDSLTSRFSVDLSKFTWVEAVWLSCFTIMAHVKMPGSHKFIQVLDAVWVWMLAVALTAALFAWVFGIELSMQASHDQVVKERTKPASALSGDEQLESSLQILHDPAMSKAQKSVAAWQIADVITSWARIIFAYGVIFGLIGNMIWALSLELGLHFMAVSGLFALSPWMSYKI